ncbi:hypothetical protein ES703_99481 [subsurface metagenome]
MIDLQQFTDRAGEFLYMFFLFRPGIPHFFDQVGEGFRLQGPQGQVLQLPLDPGHPQTVGQGSVDIPRLDGDAPLLDKGQVLNGAHVMNTVGELDYDHPDVLGY